MRTAEASRQRPLVGLSLMPDAHFLALLRPLLERGAIEAVEWTIDFSFEEEGPAELLDFCAESDRLFGHGVGYSPLSARRSQHQERWLAAAKEATRRRRYRRLSEHFGFLRAPPFRSGPPLPMPFTKDVLRIGQDRLKRLADATGVPVGLENLALAFSREDALRHGEFLDALLEPVDGFLCLDLHNLYCQQHNFGSGPVIGGMNPPAGAIASLNESGPVIGGMNPPAGAIASLNESGPVIGGMNPPAGAIASLNAFGPELLASYPLDRVRVLHVSGGSFSQPSMTEAGQLFRRDTHDSEVPREVFALLPAALAAAPNVELIMLERLSESLESPHDLERDLEALHAILDEEEAL